MHPPEEKTDATSMKGLGKSALLFAAIGLLLYAGAYFWAERLVYRTGDSNPLFKIATAEDRPYDWVILGASHAMPLDFEDFNATMERETGRRILNLAAPGAGPLYNRFALEHFLRRHETTGLIYVLDSFAFYSRTWNEDRFADAKLLRRTPFSPAVARRLLGYGMDEGVDAVAVLDYVTGFSKINNRNRFEPDIWEGEAKFDRAFRPSAAAERKRIAYLYPDHQPEVFLRYLKEFEELIALARRQGVRVVVIKMPVPGRFHDQLPNETAFDEIIQRRLSGQQVQFHDFSMTMDEPRFYFDTDHLNRVGLTAFFTDHLKAILDEDRLGGVESSGPQQSN